jgi:hypothetical protein
MFLSSASLTSIMGHEHCKFAEDRRIDCSELLCTIKLGSKSVYGSCVAWLIHCFMLLFVSCLSSKNNKF